MKIIVWIVISSILLFGGYIIISAFIAFFDPNASFAIINKSDYKIDEIIVTKYTDTSFTSNNLQVGDSLNMSIYVGGEAAGSVYIIFPDDTLWYPYYLEGGEHNTYTVFNDSIKVKRGYKYNL